MKKAVHSSTPTMMIHHVKEIQMRLLITVLVLVAGMVLGYFFYEQLFQFIKAPLDGPLHYTSPAGSFSFVIKVCFMVGVIAALPVGVYNVIMFVQPALKKQLSKVRVYVTTALSLVFAGLGASFAFLIIIPLALRFFYKFQVDGLIALISADDYLKFVVNVVLAFVIIFQLPLLISLIDHIRPLPPMKLLKAEKYVVIGSIVIALLVPFAVDPTVQLLIASPIIILYNVSIVIVMLQQYLRRRHEKPVRAAAQTPPQPVVAVQQRRQSMPAAQVVTMPSTRAQQPKAPAALGRVRQPSRSQSVAYRQPRQVQLISDMRRPVQPRPAAAPKLRTEI